MVKKSKLGPTGNGKLAFHCPACGNAHMVNIDQSKSPYWTWNGSVESPTFTPSVRVTWSWGPQDSPRCCHFFVREGQIQYLDDCTHALANQTRELPDWLSSEPPTEQDDHQDDGNQESSP